MEGLVVGNFWSLKVGSGGLNNDDEVVVATALERIRLGDCPFWSTLLSFVRV